MQPSVDSGISRIVDLTAHDRAPNDRSAALSVTGAERRDGVSLPHHLNAAMERRLLQLKAALGESSTRDLPPPSSAKASLQDQHASPTPRLFRASTLFATALVSASSGATGAWVAANTGSTLPGPSTPAVASRVASDTVESTPVAVAAPSLAVSQAHPIKLPDEQQVAESLERWRQAWSNRDVESYLAHYSPAFVPAGGQARDAWVAARKKNIAARASIDVQVHDLHVERIDAERMRLRFRQDYAAGSYREQGQTKVMELVREGAEWRIVAERQGTS